MAVTVQANDYHLPENWRDEFCGKETSCYDVLNVTQDSSKEEVVQSYKKLARKHHPDRNRGDPEGAAERFRAIQLARDILSDPEKRKIYDDVTALRARLYVPKESPIIVLLFVVGGCFTAAYCYQLSEYNFKRKSLLANNAVKNRLRSELQKTGKAVRIKNNKLDEDVSDELLTTVVKALGVRVQGGWTGQKPQMMPIVISAPFLPFRIIGWGLWCLKWIAVYTILNKDYSQSDKEYLTYKSLDLTHFDWTQMSEGERTKHMDSELWTGRVSKKGQKKKQ